MDRNTKEVIATILIVDIDRNKIRLGLEAEQTVQFYREEILPAEYKGNRDNSQPGPQAPPGGG